MNGLSLFKNFEWSALKQAIRNRGIKSTLLHALRRTTTFFEFTLLGPDFVRLSPCDFQCNHACPICWLHNLDPETLETGLAKDRTGSLSIPEYRRLFNTFPFGVHEINVVGGGEPLMYPDIIELFREIKRHKWKGNLITNATLLNKTMARDMIDMHWDALRVSIHAGDPETYRNIHGRDNFHRMMSNLKFYNDYRHRKNLSRQCKLIAFHVIQRENIHSLENLFTVALEIGADFIEFDLIIPFSEAHRLLPEEIGYARETLLHAIRKFPIATNADEILPQLTVAAKNATGETFVPGKFCSVGFDQTFITGSGDVLPCCFSNEVMGNIRQTEFHKIWFGEKYHGFRKRLIRGKFAAYCIANRCSLPGVLHQ